MVRAAVLARRAKESRTDGKWFRRAFARERLALEWHPQGGRCLHSFRFIVACFVVLRAVILTPARSAQRPGRLPSRSVAANAKRLSIRRSSISLRAFWLWFSYACHCTPFPVPRATAVSLEKHQFLWILAPRNPQGSNSGRSGSSQRVGLGGAGGGFSLHSDGDMPSRTLKTLRKRLGFS